MRNGSNGNGHDETHTRNGEDASPRPSIEELLQTLGPPRDRVDRLMQFTMRQTDDLLKLFVSQMTHVTTHLALLEFEIAQLKAAQGGGASKPNGADKETCQ